MPILVAGVDAGVGEGRTGVAVAEYRRGSWLLLEAWTTSMPAALGILESLGVAVVAVDSPLSHATRGAWRGIDLVGRRLGLRLLPPGWRGMRRLVEAASLLKNRSWVLLETHPSSVARVAGCSSREELVERCFDAVLAEPRGDALDAAVAACVARCFLSGCWARVEAVDGSIWLVDPGLCG